MDFVVQSDRMRFVLAAPVEPVTEYGKDEQRKNRDGVLLWQVTVLALSATARPELLAVKLAGPVAPQVPEVGTAVRVVGLVASPWQRGERAGTAYRADAIEPTDGAIVGGGLDALAAGAPLTKTTGGGR